jgi:hypothetical protein
MRENIIFILVWGIFLSIVITTGCTSDGQASQPATPTNEVTVTTPSIQPAVQITKDDIKQHFMDTAFGPGSNFLYRQPNRYSLSIGINSDENLTLDSDHQALRNFIQDFNSYSKTITLREDTWDTNADLKMNIVSHGVFENIHSPAIISHNNVIYAKGEYPDSLETIYITADLKGNERNYTIVKSLLLWLGFRGETLRYNDSIFSAGNYDNQNLSYIDKKAIEIMYGPDMFHGMTVQNANSVLFPK